MNIIFWLSLLGILGIGASFSLSSPDPLKQIYVYSGFLAFGFCVASVILTRFKKKMWARKVGLTGLFFAFLHFLNFIILDKYLEPLEIFREFFRSKFILAGLLSFLLLVGAGLLSFKKTQRYIKTRRVFVYIALALAGVHIFLGVKVAGVLEYFCLIIGILIYFATRVTTHFSKKHF